MAKSLQCRYIKLKMNNITWKEVDYKNNSLNNIARNITEFHTGNCQGDISYSKTEGTPIGTIFLEEKYTVKDMAILNSLLNYNVYFRKNTEQTLKTDLKPDCAVVLASGNTVDQIESKYMYVIDISPKALQNHQKAFNMTSTEYYELDVFDLEEVRKFLRKCKGETGLFCLSNIFLYLPNCIMFDAKARLTRQNKLMQVLAEDKIEWYVDMCTVNGIYFQAPARELVDMKLDDKFKVLPWI